MSKPALTITSDFTKDFNETVKRFKGDAVLIGIPQTESSRSAKADSPEHINNATLLAINHFGSPKNNIPPRPVLFIGLKNAQDAIAEQFKIAAKKALTQGSSALHQYYERAGIIASNACKRVINEQDSIDEPASSTLDARQAKGFKGTKALLVTAQMRNAITYVVKNIWGA